MSRSRHLPRLWSVDSPASQAPSSADCCSASSTASSDSKCLSFATPSRSLSSCSCSWFGPVACWAGTRRRRSRRGVTMHWLRTRGRATAPYGLGLAAVLVIPALLNIIPGVAPGYVLYLVSLALIYAVVAIGLGILIGQTGQISLGHAGFFAIGAYASALLTLLLGLPALRLSGPYLAVATLGFGLAIPQLVVWQGSWTGGSSGLHGLPLASLPLGAFTIVFRTDQDYYYLTAAVLIVLTIFARNVVTSHTGRAFVAIRDSEIA